MVELPLSERSIADAYNKLEQARADLGKATERVTLRRLELQQAKYEAVAHGRIEGRNETERESKARDILPDYYRESELAELDEGRLKLRVELCRIEIEGIQAVLRFLSIPGRSE